MTISTISGYYRQVPEYSSLVTQYDVAVKVVIIMLLWFWHHEYYFGGSEWFHLRKMENYLTDLES